MPNVSKCESYKNSGSEWLGDIPASWPMVMLSQIVTQVKNKNTDLAEKNLLSLSYGRIKRKPIDTSGGLLPASFDGYNIIEANDIVLRLTDLQNDHTSLRVGLSAERGIITSAYTTMRPKNTKGAKYIYYLLHTFDIRKGFYGMGSGVRQGLNYDEVKRLKLPLPTEAEQVAIADFLDTKVAHIDAVIAEAKASIEEYKAWKASIISEAVTKGLDPTVEMKDSGIEWIGVVPKNWKLEKLKRYTSMLTPMRDKPERLDGEIPWIRIEDYCGKYIDSSKEGLGVSSETVLSMNLKVYPVGTILCTSSCDLGKCAIVSRPLVSNQRFIGIIPNEGIFPDFLYYLMLSNAERLNYLSTGAIQANLSRVAFEQLIVQVPPYSEQREIAKYLDEKTDGIDTAIQEKHALVHDLESYKKSLIFEVVTGKRRVC